MSDVEVAELLAVAAHDGQVDKAGRPYFEHVQAVAAALERYGDDAVMAGFLHDIVEDTDITLDYLRAAGFPAGVVDAVDAVTRRAGEPYGDMIRRAAAHPLGRLVKLADNAHNSDPDRLAALDAPTAKRLAGRYVKARAVLLAADPLDLPAVPNWRDIRTGTEAAWREFADRHGIRYHPDATRYRIATNVRAWIKRRDEEQGPGQ